MRKLLVLLLLTFATGVWAQNYNVNIGGIQWSSGPSVPGSCSPDGSWFYLNTGSKGWYQCNSGTYGITPSSPALSGTPTAPTAAPFTNSTQIATTNYVDSTIYGGGTFSIVDDFTTGSANSTTVSSATSVSFDSYWVVSPVTAGTTGTIARSSNTFVNPGEILFTTVATTGDGLVIGKSDNNGKGPLGILGANTNWQVDVWIQTGATITNYAIRAGVTSGTNSYIADAPTGGAWAEFDTANASSNTNWMLRTVNSSTSNFVSSGVAVAGSTWYHLRISSTVIGTISMQVGSANGALGAPVTSSTDVDSTNIYTLAIQLIPRSNAAVTATLDRVSFIAKTGRL